MSVQISNKKKCVLYKIELFLDFINFVEKSFSAKKILYLSLHRDIEITISQQNEQQFIRPNEVYFFLKRKRFCGLATNIINFHKIRLRFYQFF